MVSDKLQMRLLALREMVDKLISERIFVIIPKVIMKILQTVSNNKTGESKEN